MRMMDSSAEGFPRLTLMLTINNNEGYCYDPRPCKHFSHHNSQPLSSKPPHTSTEPLTRMGLAVRQASKMLQNVGRLLACLLHPALPENFLNLLKPPLSLLLGNILLLLLGGFPLIGLSLDSLLELVCGHAVRRHNVAKDPNLVDRLHLSLSNLVPHFAACLVLPPCAPLRNCVSAGLVDSYARFVLLCAVL